MSYDFQGAGDVPQLEEYKIRLAKQLLRSCFYQEEKKETYDMLR